MLFYCQMTCALKEMMLNGQSQDAVVSLFPQLFSSLLVRLGSSLGVTLPKDINSSGTNRKSPTKLSAGFDVCGWVRSRHTLASAYCIIRHTGWSAGTLH